MTRGEVERCTFSTEKWRAWLRVCRTHQRLKSAIVFFFRKYVVFWLSAFAHKKMKAGKGIYDCDDVSVTKARPTRSKN